MINSRRFEPHPHRAGCLHAKSSPLHRRPSGFTLVELLVVMGIVTILVTVIFALFSPARAKARSAKCQSNLRQIGLAFAQYTQDFNNHYPRNGWCPSWAPGCTGAHSATPVSPTLWFHAVDAYTKNSEVYNCPDATQWPQKTDALGKWIYSSAASYGWNVYTLNGVRESTPYHGVDAAKVEDPAGTILVGDAMGYYRMTGYHTSIYRGNSAGVANRHLDGTNILWADGHVKWQRPETLLYNPGSRVPGVWTLAAGD